MREENVRLNPFMYLSETDIRFYLLVFLGIFIPFYWAFLFWVIILFELTGLEISLVVRFLLVLVIALSILLYTYRNYRTYPQKILRESRLREFSQIKFPEQYGCLEKLRKSHLPVAKPPILTYQPLDPSQSAFTFGTKNDLYIGINGGLIMKFRKNIKGFKLIILHELGHIVNGDVEKAYLAAAAWQSLFNFLLLSLGTMVAVYLYEMSYILFLGTSLGESISLFGAMNPARALTVFGQYTFFFIIILVFVYILRNQIIRVREFYADARVLEWEKSPDGLIQTLEESVGKEFSKFEILRKFHPTIQERIQVLKDNKRLFFPGFGVAFTVGFFLLLIEVTSSILETVILTFSSEALTALQGVQYEIPVILDIGFRAFRLCRNHPEMRYYTVDRKI
jgi:Zn-dependent protease with chaperone function